MKRIAASLLIAVSLTAGALTPNGFKAVVADMQQMAESRADSLARSLIGSAAVLEQVMDMARELLFNPESDNFNEAVYSSFARAEAASEFASLTQRALAEWEVYAIGLNAPGSEAADFEVVTADGSESTMKAVAGGEPAILYFYNPDCRHCSQTLERLRGRRLPAKVLAVCVDSTRKRWEETRSALPADWIPLFDANDVQAEDLYVFIATPSIYILDADGTVTAKNPPLNSLTNAEE